jgi:uncharacterized protein with GYD domain
MPALLEYVRGLDGKEIKSAAPVTSCVSKQKRQDGVRAILNKKGIEVLDEFLCQGGFLLVGVGHPNKKDVEDAVRFAKRLSAARS